MKRYQPMTYATGGKNAHEESLIGGSCGQKFVTQKSRYLSIGTGPSFDSIIKII